MTPRLGDDGSGNQNLDSLLDTMANVVGILVVVMAVAQISVGHTAQRLREADELRAELQADEDLAALPALEAELDESPNWRFEVERELARLRARLAEESEADAAPALDSQRARAAAALATEALAVRSLEAEIEAKRRRLSSLRLELAEFESEADASTAVVRLPDPRPAPPGRSGREFVARYGRIATLDFEQLKAQLSRSIQEELLAANASGLTTNSFSQLARRFEEKAVGNEDFRWSLFDRGRLGLVARIEWRQPDETGEGTRRIRSRDSAFQHQLGKASPLRHYLHFHVWSDSFAVYLEARRIAEEAGFAVGWSAYDERAELEGHVTTGAVPQDPLPVD